MALRRRQKRTDQSKIDATPPWETRHRDEPEPTTGPYDVRDAPDDEFDRVDVGALLVPAVPGLEIGLGLNEAQQVESVTLRNRNGELQVTVFAAPRTEGIWDDIRKEIRDSIVSQGGLARDKSDGPFGVELAGTLKGDGGNVAVRFLGQDGPRWFLRGMLRGPAAAEASKARPFEDAFRNVVVVRGAEALPIRHPIELQFPKEVAELLAAQAEAADDDAAPS
jgi:hypothetical protein